MVLDDLRAKVRPSGPVLDVHVHPLHGFGPHPVDTPAADAELLAAAAGRAGVTKICLFSLHPACPREPEMAQCREANDYALRMRDARPELLLPLCYVTPARPRESVAEIERCVAGERMAGVKLWVARRAIDPGLDPILEQATALGVPVLQHAWRKTVGQLEGESYPADVAALARRHPKAKIVMAHLNGVNPRGLEEVADCPNIAVDTAGGDPEGGMVELAVARLGPGRVVYGSDAPIRHFAVMMSKILGAELPGRVKRDILWNNAVRLLPPWAGVETC
jgi:uncharacterized protein